MHCHDTVLICRTVDVHPTRWSPPPRPDGPSVAPQENSTLERGKLLGWDQVSINLVLGSYSDCLTLCMCIVYKLKLMKCWHGLMLIAQAWKRRIAQTTVSSVILCHHH